MVYISQETKAIIIAMKAETTTPQNKLPSTHDTTTRESLQ
jgi:hypothetical protein